MPKNKKKCPHCGKWSVWNLNDQDKCVHCGGHLFTNAKQIAQSRKSRSELKVNLLEIASSDSKFIVILKKIVNFVHLVFMAIISAIMWFITTVAV